MFKPLATLPPVRTISLNRGLFAEVDASDFDELARVQWTARFQPRTQSYDVVRKKDGKMVYMSREIMQPESSEVVDHINHQTLDNRKSNLRVTTKLHNNRNRRLAKTNKSGFKGVFRYPGGLSKPWAARIKVYGKQIHLGYFLTPEEAAKKYDAAAKTHFGEFAYLNFGGPNV